MSLRLKSRWTSPRLTIGLTLGLNIAHYSVGYVSPSWIQGFFLDKVQDFLWIAPRNACSPRFCKQIVNKSDDLVNIL
jgi:hypothetical protein